MNISLEAFFDYFSDDADVHDDSTRFILVDVWLAPTNHPCLADSSLRY